MASENDTYWRRRNFEEAMAVTNIRARLRKYPVCESCLLAAVDDGAGHDIAEEICRDYGDHIEDHCCEVLETDDPCGCGCGRTPLRLVI